MKAREEEIVPITCGFCSKVFQASKKSKWCSSKCQQAYRRLIGANSIQLVCPVCGMHFTRNNKFVKSKTCSRPCTMKLKQVTHKIDTSTHRPVNYFSLGNELIRMNELNLTHDMPRGVQLCHEETQ